LDNVVQCSPVGSCELWQQKESLHEQVIVEVDLLVKRLDALREEVNHLVEDASFNHRIHEPTGVTNGRQRC